MIRLDRLPPLTVEVDCSGARHRLTWRREGLVVHDHDTDAETVAAALGADSPFCLRVVSALASGSVDMLSLVGDAGSNPRRRGLEGQLAGGVGSPWPAPKTQPQRVAQARGRAVMERAPHLRTVWALPSALRHRIVLAAILSDPEPDQQAAEAVRALERGARLDAGSFRVIARGIPARPVPDDDEGRILARFFDGSSLIEIPAQRSKRLVILRRLARELEPGREYPEREVNRLLSAFHPDFAALRRYMVDEGLLERASGVYRRTNQPG